MNVTIFDHPDTQEFLRELSGLNNSAGSARMKEITHRLMSDLFRAIDDLNITPDESWQGVAWLNDLGAAGQAGLISPVWGSITSLTSGWTPSTRPWGSRTRPPAPSKAPCTWPGPRNRPASRAWTTAPPRARRW